MGAWGVGPFDNDGAMDWASDFAAAAERAWIPWRRTRRDVVQIALARDLVKDWEYEEEALAAAETVAAMLGRPLADLPDEVGNSISAGMNVPADWRRLAIDVCDHLLTDRSNLNGCLAETTYRAEWLDSINDLKQRLASSQAGV